MDLIKTDMQVLFSYLLAFLGLFLWLWGTTPLLTHKKDFLYKLHTLTVSDTVGSIIILLSFIVRAPSKWPIFLLAIFSLAIWNTVLGYLMGSLSDKS